MTISMTMYIMQKFIIFLQILLSQKNFSMYFMSPVVFSRGTGSDGTGLFKKVQSGSQPSFRFQTRSLSGGTVFLSLKVINIKNEKTLTTNLDIFNVFGVFFSKFFVELKFNFFRINYKGILMKNFYLVKIFEAILPSPVTL